MKTENNNFDEMTSNALLNVDETLEKNPEKEPVENPYKLDDVLLKDGNMFDNTGVYFHFKPSFQRAGVDPDNDRFKTKEPETPTKNLKSISNGHLKPPTVS